MPFFLQEYRVYNDMVEQEMVTTIYEDEQYIVKLMSRPDLVCERLSDEQLLLWELKTVGMVTSQWIKRWTHALQLLLQVYATQQFLRLNGDDREVAGIVVEGVVKGQRKRDSSGVKRQQSNLIYAYCKRGDGFIVKDKFSYVWKKGLDKTLISREMPIEQWIHSLPETTLQDSIAVVPPLLASTEDIQAVLTQVSHRAIELFNKGVSILDVDKVWPQNFSACHEFDDCHMLSACFMHEITQDPKGSGLYVNREPNHPYEKTWIGGTLNGVSD